jgi:hypothetical protein
VAFFNRRLDAPGGWTSGVGVAAAVAVVVVAVGYMASRRHMSAAGSRQISVARGPVEVLSETEQDCRVRIGGTALRLPGVDAVEAFQPAAEYRVYYLAGSVALVLSGEALSGGGAARESADADADDREHVTAAGQITVVRRGYVVVVLLGFLALGIPVAGTLVGDLPARLRPLAWIGLLVIAIGFAWLAVSWLTARPRRRA